MTGRAGPPRDAPVPGLVVELCGLPGAGKTTVARALVARLRQQGRYAEVVDEVVSAAVPLSRRLPRKASLLVRVTGARPGRAARAAWVLGPGQPSLRDVVAVPVQWWVAERLLGTAGSRGGTAVVEEGLVQALWTAGLRSRRATVPGLVDLALEVRRPDLLVHLDVQAERALERLRSRGSRHSRVQRLTWTEQLETMRKGDALLRELLAEWARRDLSELLVVAEGADGDENGPVTDLLARLGALQ